MDYIEVKLNLLKENLLDMTHIVTIQVQKSKQAFLNKDDVLAMEVVHKAKRINILSQQIEYDCKNILALYTPVAVDLRFILSSLKICQSLEQIGTHSEKICKLGIKISNKTSHEHFIGFHCAEMFSHVIKMLHDFQKALFNNDAKLAKKICRGYSSLSHINQEATKTAIEWIKRNPKDTKIILRLLEVTRSIERIGDHAKTVSEMVVFHQKAKLIARS